MKILTSKFQQKCATEYPTHSHEQQSFCKTNQKPHILSLLTWKSETKTTNTCVPGRW